MGLNQDPSPEEAESEVSAASSGKHKTTSYSNKLTRPPVPYPPNAPKRGAVARFFLGDPVDVNAQKAVEAYYKGQLRVYREGLIYTTGVLGASMAKAASDDLQELLDQTEAGTYSEQLMQHIGAM